MRRDVDELAETLGIVSHAPGSLSRFVPSRRAFRSEDLTLLHELADRIQIPKNRLRFEPNYPRTIRDVVAHDPPIRYEKGGTFEFTMALGVEASYWKRRDAPSYWTVKSDKQMFWSYHRNVAHFLARKLSGEPTHNVVGTNLHAWTPLPVTISRWLVAIGAPSAGESLDGSRVYPTPSEAVAQHLSSYIDSLFDRLVPSLKVATDA